MAFRSKHEKQDQGRSENKITVVYPKHQHNIRDNNRGGVPGKCRVEYRALRRVDAVADAVAGL